MDEHVQVLVDQLKLKADRLKLLQELKYEMGINCTGYYTQCRGFHLSRRLVADCAMLGLSLDFDLYSDLEEGEPSN